MRLPFPIVLAAAAGCGVKLGEDPTTSHAIVDASPEDSASAHDAAAPPADARPCTGGSANITSGTSCFVFMPGPVTYTDAVIGCTGMQAHLAILDSLAKDTAAESILTVDTFIGATDVVTEMTFLWVDGTTVKDPPFTNWHTGEPNNGGNAYQEDCIVVAGARVGKGWDDRPCAPEAGVATAGKYGYLCEY